MGPVHTAAAEWYATAGESAEKDGQVLFQGQAGAPNLEPSGNDLR